MSITKPKLAIIRKELQSLLAPFNEADNGFNIDLGNCSFTDNNATLKLELSTVSADGQLITKDRSAFIEYAPLIGMKESDLDTEFTSSGKTYILVGYNPKARTMPLLAARKSDGVRFKFRVDDVKRALLQNAA